MPKKKSGNCRAKIGLLVLRECGDAVLEACRKCNIPLCAKHSVTTFEGIACPDCAAQESGSDATKEGAMAGAAAGVAAGTLGAGALGRARWRRGYHDRFGYTPMLFGRRGYYTDRDRAALEEQDAGGIKWRRSRGKGGKIASGGDEDFDDMES